MMARAEQVVAPPFGQRERQGLGQPDPGDQPVPTIWVTNRIEQIDPAFRRRFAYHLELKSPPPGAPKGAQDAEALRSSPSSASSPSARA